MSQPQILIQDLTAKMLHALKVNKDQLEKDPSIIYSIVKDILMPSFYFERMSKFALGKH